MLYDGIQNGVTKHGHLIIFLQIALAIEKRQVEAGKHGFPCFARFVKISPTPVNPLFLILHPPKYSNFFKKSVIIFGNIISERSKYECFNLLKNACRKMLEIGLSES